MEELKNKKLSKSEKAALILLVIVCVLSVSLTILLGVMFSDLEPAPPDADFGESLGAGLSVVVYLLVGVVIIGGITGIVNIILSIIGIVLSVRVLKAEGTGKGYIAAFACLIAYAPIILTVFGLLANTVN